MKKLLFIFILLVVQLIATANEYWLQPQKFKFDAGEKIVVDFMVGENFEGSNWDKNRQKVEKAVMFNRISNRISREGTEPL